MKKQSEEQPKRVIPAFATEAEEAEWWYKNRNIHGKQLLAAVKNGEANVLTKEKLRELSPEGASSLLCKRLSFLNVYPW